MENTGRKENNKDAGIDEPGYEATFGYRLRKVSDIVGGTKKLADQWGMASPGLYNYFHNRTKPGMNILLRLYRLGFGLEWLITGTGVIFANNAAGRKLRRKLAVQTKAESGESINSRLNDFVKVNFNSVDEFAAQLGKKTKDIQPFLESRKPTYGLLEELAALGCNLNWLMLGMGAQVARPPGEAGSAADAPQDTFVRIRHSADYLEITEVSIDQIREEDSESEENSDS